MLTGFSKLGIRYFLTPASIGSQGVSMAFIAFTLPPGMPPWVPAAVIIPVFFAVVIGLSLIFRTRIRGVYGPRHAPMSFGLMGYLHYRSATKWYGVWTGFVLALVATQLPLLQGLPFIGAGSALAIVCYLRPNGAVQNLHVDQNGAITLIRSDAAIPFDLNHFRYVRMYEASTEGSAPHQSMLVLSRDTPPTFSTWLSSVFLPRVDGERVVLFYTRWRDADGAIIANSMLDDLFQQACARAGRPPEKRDSGFGSSGWDVRPQRSPQ